MSLSLYSCHFSTTEQPFLLKAESLLQQSIALLGVLGAVIPPSCSHQTFACILQDIHLHPVQGSFRLGCPLQLQNTPTQLCLCHVDTRLCQSQKSQQNPFQRVNMPHTHKIETPVQQNALPSHGLPPSLLLHCPTSQHGAGSSKRQPSTSRSLETVQCQVSATHRLGGKLGMQIQRSSHPSLRHTTVACLTISKTALLRHFRRQPWRHARQ